MDALNLDRVQVQCVQQGDDIGEQLVPGVSMGS